VAPKSDSAVIARIFKCHDWFVWFILYFIHFCDILFQTFC